MRTIFDQADAARCTQFDCVVAAVAGRYVAAPMSSALPGRSFSIGLAVLSWPNKPTNGPKAAAT
jgi:hypothetical protein